MAHHGDDSEALAMMGEMLRNQFEQAKYAQSQINLNSLGLGATGQFPEGKLNEDDEGEIKIAIGSEAGKVVVGFGKPVAWIGFTKEQAREIGELLIKHSAA